MNDIEWTPRAPATVPAPSPEPAATATEPEAPGRPTREPLWPRRTPRRPRPEPVPYRRSQLVAAALAAAAVEVARHSGPASIGAALAVSAMAAVMLAVRRRPADWVWAGAVAALGVAVATTSAPWLIGLDLTASIAILALMACRPGGRSLSVPEAVGGIAALGRHLPAVPTTAARQGRAALPAVAGPTRAQIGRLVRSLVVAAPVVAGVAVLLATADSLVRTWLDLPDLGPGPVVGVLTVSLSLWLALGLARTQLDPGAPARWRWWRPSTLDALVTMAGVTVVLAGYAVVRVSAALAGSDYIERRTGLTYAQYARAGFFQLLGAAALAVLAVVVTRTAAPGRWLAGLRLAAGATVLALVVCTAHGFVLYREAYGLTRLRITCLAILVWITAVVLVVMIGELSSVVRRYSTTASVGAGIGIVLALHLLNPDLLIARTNLELAERTGRIDLDYLERLSPDAAPALGTAYEVLDTRAADALAERWCAESGTALAWNLSHWRADTQPECP